MARRTSYKKVWHNECNANVIRQIMEQEVTIKGGDRPARELAQELLPYLETIANLHYLLDWNVETPERLVELRTIEDEAFTAMLKRVLNHLQ